MLKFNGKGKIKMLNKITNKVFEYLHKKRMNLIAEKYYDKVKYIDNNGEIKLLTVKLIGHILLLIYGDLINDKINFIFEDSSFLPSTMLKYYRENKSGRTYLEKMTQRQLAKKSGISVFKIFRYEKNVMPISKEDVVILAKALNLNDLDVTDLTIGNK